MRVLENPGRHVMVEDGDVVVIAERVSPMRVEVQLEGDGVTASGVLSDDAGMALLRGLAALYDCEVVQH